MTGTSSKNSKAKAVVALLIAMTLCGQWLFFSHLHDLTLGWRTFLPGLTIFGSAFLLAWGSEVLQFDIPRTLAFAFVALVAILPEYAVDIYFAWQGGKDPAYVQYALANMTGANRILIGVGWTLVVFAYVLRSRRGEIMLEEGHRVEMMGLVFATLYAFILPLKGSISLVDSVILFTIFGIYLRSAIKANVVEPELEGGPVELMATLVSWKRRCAALALFILAGAGILTAAEPFAEGLLEVGAQWGVDQFIMVQWIAPLASESPEFLIATIFALRNKPTAGLSTVISSMINQWTLLVGALPIAFCLSAGVIQPMVMDARQVEEIFLTAAQSFFAMIVVINLHFRWWEAVLLFVLFATQIFFPSTSARYGFACVYLALALIALITSRGTRQSIPKALKVLFR
ncbi:MAG: sodium:calcium antiporter [Deltaproteobacteria bacterium]|nr:sodium:calcium antiporter [Deltaproteobacteria bacterium]